MKRDNFYLQEGDVKPKKICADCGSKINNRPIHCKYCTRCAKKRKIPTGGRKL